MLPPNPTLLGLPVEIRQQIWSYVKDNELHVQPCHSTHSAHSNHDDDTQSVAGTCEMQLFPMVSWPVLRVSRQIHAEFMPLPRNERTFTFCSTNCAQEAYHGCTHAQKSAWKAVRLHHVIRTAKHDADELYLLPVLKMGSLLRERQDRQLSESFWRYQTYQAAQTPAQDLPYLLRDVLASNYHGARPGDNGVSFAQPTISSDSEDPSSRNLTADSRRKSPRRNGARNRFLRWVKQMWSIRGHTQ